MEAIDFISGDCISHFSGHLISRLSGANKLLGEPTAANLKTQKSLAALRNQKNMLWHSFSRLYTNETLKESQLMAHIGLPISSEVKFTAGSKLL